MPEKTKTSLSRCWFRCRPVMRVFIVKRKGFSRRDAIAKPWLLCVGSKRASSLIVSRHAEKSQAVAEMQGLLTWMDSPTGQAAYQEALKAIVPPEDRGNR